MQAIDLVGRRWLSVDCAAPAMTAILQGHDRMAAFDDMIDPPAGTLDRAE